MKRVLCICLISFCLQACTKGGSALGSKDVQVALVLSTGGLGDGSFNDAAYKGLERIQQDYGIMFSLAEPATPADYEEELDKMAEAGFDLVIATGYLMKESCEKVAEKYPDTKFAIIDAKSDLPNVASLTFKEAEGSFLVGALAAMVSKTANVGFVGGMDMALINTFGDGFGEGLRYINEEIAYHKVYLDGPDPFNDPSQAKSLTEKLVKEHNVDVVYHAAGGSGAGVISACANKKIWAIGVEVNQDEEAPGTVLTSMIKKADVAVYRICRDVIKGKFKAKIYQLGIKEDGIGTTDFSYTKDKIDPAHLQKLEEIKEQIKTGEIRVKP